MSLLSEILKEIPLSAVLKEKVATIEAENAGLKTENAILKDDLREARAQLKRVKERLHELSHQSDLDETDVLLLREIAAVDTDPAAAYVAKTVNLDSLVVKHRLERHCDRDYLSAWSDGGPDRYSLQPKSREFLIKNNLMG